MSAKKAIGLLFFCLLFVSTPGNSFARDAAEKESTALNQKVQTSRLSGINLWIAETYNSERTLYAITVTIVMAALGTSLAFLTDLVLKALGLEVSRISHRE
ncbi:MAG: hypothetical protein M1469_12510 [Bacteroidetes bacterium]|nr:hypothetical protein [Bacteroidota bacterium]MCL5268901.1 hypothetical protein [Bacteroidota bacterium]